MSFTRNVGHLLYILLGIFKMDSIYLKVQEQNKLLCFKWIINSFNSKQISDFNQVGDIFEECIKKVIL